MHHLLLIGNQGNRQLHLVVGQTGGERDVNTGDKKPTLISLKPKLQGFQGQIRSFGYVGAFLAELAREIVYEYDLGIFIDDLSMDATESTEEEGG